MGNLSKFLPEVKDVDKIKDKLLEKGFSETEALALAEEETYPPEKLEKLNKEFLFKKQGDKIKLEFYFEPEDFEIVQKKFKINSIGMVVNPHLLVKILKKYGDEFADSRKFV